MPSKKFDEPQNKVFPCTLCDKEYKRADYLKAHEKSIHLKIKPYECGHCKMSFVVEVQLKDHVGRVHLKVKLVMIMVLLC